MELLEERSVPSADILALDMNSGDWKAATPSENGFEVSTIGRWEPSNLIAVVHGDFDGDGVTDSAGWSNLGCWIVGRMGADGLLQTEQWLTGSNGAIWKAVRVGDFDGDGKDDIAAFSSGAAWWVFRSTGTSFEAALWTQFGAAIGWKCQIVGDFNNDGRSDIANFYGANGKWWIAFSTGAGFTNVTWAVFGTKTGWTNQVVGDFNGDDRTDIASFYAPVGAWYVSLNHGTALKTVRWSLNSAVRGFASKVVRDLDGDGRSDIVALDKAGRTLAFMSDGTRFVYSVAALNPAGIDKPIRLHAADFDGSGQTELALLTKSGNFFVGTFTNKAVAYANGGSLDTGNWATSFTNDTEQPNETFGNFIGAHVFSRLYFVSALDISKLRADPFYFATIFDAYKFGLRVRMGSRFLNLNDQAIAYSLATIVAYEAASYRGINDPEGIFPRPKSFAPRDLLAVRKLICNEYCYLATGLYRIAFPLADDPATIIGMITTATGPFGNHGQMVFTSGGVTLVCDPNLGLIARTTFKSLLAGVRVSSADILQIVYRVESTTYMENALATFRQAVVGALVNGRYPQATFLKTQDFTQYS